MLELKNSKTTYLGKAPDGREKFALDCFIGAVQMREPAGEWVDIKPRLVRKPTDDGYYVDRVPYYAEFNDDGSRLFCPDKYQRREYFGLPTIPLLSNLPKNLVSSPTKLDGEILPNRIVMPAYWGEIRIPFTNTAMRFEVLFNEAPPSAIFGQDSPRIIFNTDLAGLDILKLLSSRQGIGIPRPRLIDDDGIERWLDWSFKNGQLELGFDLTGLKFPVLLKNTTLDLQVGASADDSQTYEEAWTNDNMNFGGGKWGGYPYESQARFDVTIPGGQSITACYLSLCCRLAESGNTALTKVWAEDVDDPNQIADYADFMGVTPTTAQVDWDISDAWVFNEWYNSDSFLSVEQELYASYDYSSGAHQNWFWKDDGSASEATRVARSYDSASANAPKLHIEYEAGGGGGSARGWWSK